MDRFEFDSRGIGVGQSLWSLPAWGESERSGVVVEIWEAA